MSDTSERIWAWENWHRDGQKSGQWCNYTKNGTEYIRDDLYEAERARADKAEVALKATLDRETAMIARHDARVAKLEAERDAAIAAMSEAARLRGEAEGKLLAAETPGMLEGWRRRAEAAEAKLAEYKMVASAIDNQWAQEVEAARALTAERDALAGKLSNALRMLDEQDLEYNRKTNTLIERHAEQISKQAAERDALAGKMAKAVKALRRIVAVPSSMADADEMERIARATLAEITGGGNE